MWWDITPACLLNGPGIVTYSLCNSCANSMQIRDRTYYSLFCATCEKRTFAMKYPGHAQKFPITLYGLKTEDGKLVENGESTWKNMLPCVLKGRGSVVSVVLGGCCRPSIIVDKGQLRFNFCEECQKRSSWAKFPKPMSKMPAKTIERENPQPTTHQSTSTEQK
ncbi:hypothetical protein CRE_19495 [Caenorhabditis remanei]|uniref:Uncharacterized protein n=1 Tax=Caenorhabditis remanei TaxID=31234 RepID=E3NG64_CAERE|nr:hypothetical protein CRE_19495 [Caenorhabditis remanei]